MIPAKKHWSNSAILTSFFLLCGIFFSCTNIEREGSVSFKIDSQTVRQISGNQDSESSAEISSSENLFLTVELSGDYNQKQTVSINKADGASVIFGNLSVGSQISAVAAVYSEITADGETKQIKTYAGESGKITIENGENRLAITLKKITTEKEPKETEPKENEPKEQEDPKEPEETLTIKTYYVSAEGIAESADGSLENPFASIEAAISAINDAELDWGINVIGTIEYSETISIPDSIEAKSITVQSAEGEEGTVINNSNTKSLFEINTSVPITFKNITLTMRNCPAYGTTINGYVLNISEGADVTLSQGFLANSLYTGNSAPAQGNGLVYVKGTLNIQTGSTLSSAQTNNGGGVYVDGGTVEMTGGQITKCWSRYGGGVHVNKGTFNMSGNAVIGGDSIEEGCEGYNDGGGVYVASTGTFTMSENSRIAFNHYPNTNASILGGGVYCEGKFIMNGGKICNNRAGVEAYQGKGGGVHLKGSDAVFTMTDGIIEGNTYASAGSGIYVNTGATFKISGNAQINSGNDVYLVSGRKVTVAGPLTGGYTPIAITPAYTTGIAVLDITENAGTQLEYELDRFEVTSQIEIDENTSETITTLWKINDEGKLFIHKNSPDSVGDIVFNDGSATPYSSGLSLTVNQKSAAVAVIFSTDDKILGIGIKNDTTPMEWAKTGTEGYSATFSAIDSTTDPASNRESSAILTATITGDTDGSDNWEEICNVDSSASSNMGNYPVWEWVNNYGTTYGFPDEFADGWYLPTLKDCVYLYNSLTTVTSALQKVGGDEIPALVWTGNTAPDRAPSAHRFSFSGTDAPRAWDNNGGNGRAGNDDQAQIAIREF